MLETKPSESTDASTTTPLQKGPAQSELDLTPLAKPELPGRLAAIVATHHPKLGHTKIDAGQFVRCLKTVRRDPEFTDGLCSLAIESPYGLGATPGGAEVGISMALACDLGLPEPASALGNLAADQPLAGVEAKVWSPLRDALGGLRDRAPAHVTQFEKLLFFETSAEESLLTPLLSLKWVHELNRRLQERDARYFQAKKAGEEPTARRVPRLYGPVGGANPQNVGYVVNKNSRNTRRGAIPMLAVRCPEDRRTDLQRALARVGATRSFARVVVDQPQTREELRAYGRRAAMKLELATHRDAEARHAREIAGLFVEFRELLQPWIAALPPLDQGAPWNRLDPNERAWLDPRVGPFEVAPLARRFAEVVGGRIARLLDPHHADAEEGERFVLPNRSQAQLRATFEEVL
ncbi:MAG: hypothetical protein HQL97_06490 [Magnetococcales bacterium]|nr:hypothetical protein [Magnetococcales bacterium]